MSAEKIPLTLFLNWMLVTVVTTIPLNFKSQCFFEKSNHNPLFIVEFTHTIRYTFFLFLFVISMINYFFFDKIQQRTIRIWLYRCFACTVTQKIVSCWSFSPNEDQSVRQPDDCFAFNLRPFTPLRRRFCHNAFVLVGEEFLTFCYFFWSVYFLFTFG